MSTTSITIPSSLTPDVLTTAGSQIGQLEPIVALIIGVLLAVVVVEILIGIFRK